MAITLSSAENALKTVYLGALANQLNTGVNPFYAQVKQSSDNVFGKEIIQMAPIGLNGGFGAGTEDGDLPEARGNRYINFKTTLKNLYGKLEISDKAILASKADSGAFVNLLNAEMEGLLEASKLNLGRMLFGDGTGKLAKVLAGSPEENLVYIESGFQNLVAGMHIQIVNTAGDLMRDCYILEVDKKNENKIYITGGNCSIEWNGGAIYLANSKDNEITGLEAIFNESIPLYGNERGAGKILSLTPKTETNELTNNSLTQMRIQSSIDEVEERTGTKINYITTSYGVRRMIMNLLSTSNRNIDTMNLKGGYSSIAFSGIPVVADRFCPKKHAYFLNTDNFTMHQLCDWRFIESENGHILHQVPNKPVYTATLVKYAEMICSKPAGLFKYSNVLE